VTIFTAVELDRLRAKQQKADTVEKLGLMALKEISNSQVELIMLTSKVVKSLDNYYGNIDTIQHVLLVCDMADKQVGVMESAMQAAMGGHVSVAAFTELNFARVALKINRDARAARLEPVARHLSDYLQMETSLCLFALFARRFELARETCRTTIGGTESAMRMVSPNSFGSYNNEAHRGLVTCSGKDTGGPESKSFTASGLTKITLPHGRTAETDTHIFAAADDGFSRLENEYTVRTYGRSIRRR
jgi:hypothetical protein